MRASVAAVVVLSVMSLAQDRPRQVCVGLPANNSRMMISEQVQRDRLVRLIKSMGENKKAKVKLTAMGLEGSTFKQTNAEAEEMKCDYLVVSSFDTIGGSNMPPISTVPTIGSVGQSPQRGAVLTYSVVAMDSGRSISDGTFRSMEMEDDSAALEMIRDLGRRVVHDISKERPPLTE